MNKKTRVTDLSGLTGASVNQNARADSNVRLSDSRADPTGLNKTLLPKLRFPEFQDSEKWKEKTLGELGDVVASGDLNDEYFSPTPSPQHIYPVYSNSIGREGLYGYYSISKYPKDSVTITARGTLGVAFIRKQDFMGVGRLIVVSDLKDTNPKFLTEGWNHLVTIPQEVTSIPQLTAVTAKSIVLPFPLLAEQQKIADCLTSLDDLIAAQSQKVAALQAYKKGLMQNLFPAEGESVPRLRFPEFESAGGWEEKTLDEICIMLNNRRLPISSENREKGPYPYYGASGIVDFVNDYIFDERLLLIGEDGAKWGSFEKTAFIAEGKYWVNNHAHVLKVNGVNDVFLENYLNMLDLSPFVAGYAPPKLTLGKLKEIPVFVPPLPEEQQRIAELLTALDEQISAQGEAVAALKVHKKGLLQGLFPNQTSEVFKTSEV